MFASLLDSKSPLHALVLARKFVQGTATQKAERTKLLKTITKPDFVDNLNKSLVIVFLVDRLIVKYQFNRVPMSEVMHAFHHLPNELVKMSKELFITAEERKYLSTFVKNLFHFMFGLARDLSYLLEPALLDDRLPSENRRSLKDTLICTPSDNGRPVHGERKEALYRQYTEFRIVAGSERQ